MKGTTDALLREPQHSDVRETLSDCAEFLADIDGDLARRCEAVLASLPQDKRIAASGIAARMRWYADHAEKRPVNIELLKADCAEAADLLASHYKRIAVLEEAVEHAAHVFRHYAELHDAKGTNEGRAKARRNMEHAERMEAALNGGSNNG